MGGCKYCGKDIAKENVSYCDRKCFRLFNSTSMHYVMENVDMMNATDKFFLMDLPLRSYNHFFKRDVKEHDYTDQLLKVAKENYEMECKFAVAYYNAAKADKDTYVPLSMLRSAVSTHVAFRRITSHVSFDPKGSVNVKERINVEHADFIKAMVSKGIVDAETLKAMKDIHVNLSMDDHMNRIGEGTAVAYITAMMAGARVKQSDVEAIVRRKMVTIRNLAVMIIDEMKKSGKITIDGRYTSDIKNLSTASMPAS
jgi:hypothetical protein